jgi:hypothetical protein
MGRHGAQRGGSPRLPVWGYEGLAESRRLTPRIFDREGLSVAYVKDLLAEDEPRQFSTCLKSNRYTGLDSFWPAARQRALEENVRVQNGVPGYE